MDSQTFDHWAILEIMGHNTYAGRVSEQTVGGAAFVRVDVPAVDSLQPFTKLFGASSIYCITPVTEEVAVARAKTLRQAIFEFVGNNAGDNQTLKETAAEGAVAAAGVYTAFANEPKPAKPAEKSDKAA